MLCSVFQVVCSHVCCVNHCIMGCLVCDPPHCVWCGLSNPLFKTCCGLFHPTVSTMACFVLPTVPHTVWLCYTLHVCFCVLLLPILPDWRVCFFKHDCPSYGRPCVLLFPQLQHRHLFFRKYGLGRPCTSRSEVV